MIIYEATKEEFMDHVTEDSIAVKIYESMVKKMGRTSASEINSWNNSMNYMYKVLNTCQIPNDITIAIEYKVPANGRRIDFILTGLDENIQNSVVIIELKQWQHISVVEHKDGVVETFIGRGLREMTHPSYQALTYANLITEYNETVRNEQIFLYPCAYLHNYIQTNNDPLTDVLYEKYLTEAPVFTKGDALKLRGFISTYIKKTDHKKLLYLIEHGKIKPSKSLQDALLGMLAGNEEFMMIDEQKIVYETAIHMAMKAHTSDKKQVLIVEGGPGTGKSVLGINLLVKLTSKDLLCQYVTKNSAPREVYTKKLQKNHKKAFITNMFKGSGVFYESINNELDVLIVDEAHRLNEKSGLFKNKGENQMKEIIHASKFSVFFIDEYQKIAMHDVGNKEQIKNYAMQFGAEIVEMELESQFRCNGSDGYLAWLDDVLGIRETANYEGFDIEYDFQIFDDPNELRRQIFEKNRIDNKARMVAGYCWDWKSDGKSNGSIHDISIEEHNFQMSWNLDNTTTWAIDPDSVEQAGCIHTSQGLEFNYVGVIIGEDLRYLKGELITDPFKRAKTDKSLSGFKKMHKEDRHKALKIADQIIKNTYRTLMTRGQKGCYVYCVDPDLKEYLTRRIQKKQEFVYMPYSNSTLLAAEQAAAYQINSYE
ncbi:DUF2075 domain-containing protein [Paenibacillus radicis (ex Xue et al. 2023)]|uniref:DUF2075 domain-containing protein n=1 Tax=Paenibacillus radicis (ex Xue et al. 2023) TaxID=2972489 RepID=A0ABT1YV42_9BACL|nr:DUF2075 domain-containing protein [Paenibacillus radicis (ex Xue et al. 2023)]MCR8636824.1 DUF2075 domain-containing protein [Paenibacillus radicis (ex Xue et al. 2023)]